jgi:hypothetical protein
VVVCVRQAWLDLYGDATVTLNLEGRGYVCQSLDLGAPTIRAVINNRPGTDGADDRTRYMGPRTVTAAITALVGAGARVDAVASGFAPFMVPAARPVLHYILDRPGAVERTLVLRAANYSWPIVGDNQRDIQLQWVAADPIVRDVIQQTQSAWSGTGAGMGRAYNLVHNRVYPPGSGAAMTAQLATPGDVAMRPLIRIYGPITWPRLTFTPQPSGPVTHFNFVSGFILATNQWVDVDAAARTVLRQSDWTQSAIGSVDWSTSTWPYIPPLPSTTIMALAGSSTSSDTQAQAIWNDGYLT